MERPAIPLRTWVGLMVASVPDDPLKFRGDGAHWNDHGDLQDFKGTTKCTCINTHVVSINCNDLMQTHTHIYIYIIHL